MNSRCSCMFQHFVFQLDRFEVYTKLLYFHFFTPQMLTLLPNSKHSSKAFAVGFPPKNVRFWSILHGPENQHWNCSDTRNQFETPTIVMRSHRFPSPLDGLPEAETELSETLQLVLCEVNLVQLFPYLSRVRNQAETDKNPEQPLFRCFFWWKRSTGTNFWAEQWLQTASIVLWLDESGKGKNGLLGILALVSHAKIGGRIGKNGRSQLFLTKMHREKTFRNFSGLLILLTWRMIPMEILQSYRSRIDCFSPFTILFLHFSWYFGCFAFFIYRFCLSIFFQARQL